MKRTFTLIFVILGMYSFLSAQTALDPEQFVNTQITEAGVYTVEPGQFYAFDGRIDLTFEVTIIGPDEGWIMNATTPPVIVGTPASDGKARQFFEIKEGGALTIKNVILSGTNNNGEIGSVFISNTGGSKLIVDNCGITDWADYALRNLNKGGDSLSVTNCVFINGMRPRYSPWGGFPVRLDVATSNVAFENNTVINSGRLLANSGPFHNANILQVHNTYISQAVAGEEQRANEFITANNIFYNYHFLGRKNELHSNPNNGYDSHFTTWNYFADSKLALDSISLYLGQNLFYRPQEVLDWFETSSGDSIDLSLLWEHADVDSFILADNNYTIGTNYSEMDPEFTAPPENLGAIVNYINASHNDPTSTWVDWRITSPVSYGADGAPALNWPPAFDMSYSNEYLQTAGTDGLPLGDLNWFADKKEEYLANKDAIIAALRDSMVNAVAVYDPLTMDQTPLITSEGTTSLEDVAIGQFYLAGNFPNPFNQKTRIEFGLDQQSKVTLSVYSLVGQLVFERSADDLAKGAHAIDFDAADLSTGIYLYKINAIGRNGQKYVASEKMIISR